MKKNISKNKKIWIIVGMFFLLLGGIVGCQKLKVQNIFDEMYYEGAGATGKAFEKPRSVFKDIPSIQNKMVDTASIYNYEEKVTEESYVTEKLPKNMDSLSITFFKKARKLHIDYTVTINNDITLFINSNYNVKKKILTKSISFTGSGLGERYTTKDEVDKIRKKYNITDQQLDEWYEIGMNKILLPDWIEVSFSNYSVANIGKVKIETKWKNQKY